MHPQERQAWYIVICVLIPTVLYAALVPWLGIGHGAEGVFGLFGAAGLAGWIGRAERKAGRVVLDERDQRIETVATVIAYSVFWVLFVATCMGPWFWLGPGGRVSVNVLPSMAMGGMIVILTTRAGAMIVMYRTGRGTEHGSAHGKAA